MKDEDYLDVKFPKGKTKYRGEALVLLALARMVERERILKLIDYKIKEKRKQVEDDMKIGFIPSDKEKMIEILTKDLEELKKEIKK